VSILKYEGYLESNLSGAVNKTDIRKKNVIIYKKETYMLKLCPNVVTARSKALVISGIKFSYACVKEVCCL
jgi:hypothetical protein